MIIIGSFSLTVMQGSVDMKENLYALPLPEVKKPNQKNVIFSSELNHNTSTTIVPPSSWATFDCKANDSKLFFVNIREVLILNL